MAASCSAMGKTALPCHYLAPPTWSVPYFVGTDLRTERLAIACGDRSGRPMHSSQVAGHDDPPYAGRGNEEDGARRTANEIALKDHLKVTE